MRITVERFRVLLVTAAALLLLIVGAFLGVARYRSRRLLQELPAKLGADIQKETNSFTWSQAVEGRTVFTIHAARAVQRANGKVTLRDVGIVLYGRDQTRADRIRGDEFEYDQRAGIVRAAGEVHLDLQASAPTSARARIAYAAGQDAEPHNTAGHDRDDHDPGMIHARTSGLLYEQRTGMLSTEREVEFTVRGITGRALGATYDTARGRLVLDHNVRLSGVRDERPMLLTAAHAATSRETNDLELRDARYVTVGETRGGRDAHEEARAGLVHVRTATAGTLERVEASDGVTVVNAFGTTRAPRATVDWSAAGKPTLARMTGGLTYSSDQPLARTNARALEGEAHFDAAGQAERGSLRGAVEISSETRAAASAAWDAGRELRAQRVDAGFSPGEGTRRELQQAVAHGMARVTLRDAAKGIHGFEQTDLAADQLTARFGRGRGVPELQRLEGDGQTLLQRKFADGTDDRSTGDHFSVGFSQKAATATKIETRDMHVPAGARHMPAVERAVQRGHVLVHQTAVRQGGAREELEAHADEAVTDASDRLQLLGSARVVQLGRTLEAERIDIGRGTGDLSAEGGVQVSYAQPGSTDLVHVLATRAEFDRGRSEAMFHGGMGEKSRVRAWQGGSQIQTPTLVVRQNAGELLAYGGTTDNAAVETVLSSARSMLSRPAGEKAENRARGPVRMTSRRLVYSNADARAFFSGGVVLRDGDGTVRSEEAVAMLRRGPGQAGRGHDAALMDPGKQVVNRGGTSVFPAGNLEKMEATGNVVLEQPGREARGDKLVYSSADGQYLLTGGPSSVMDATSGTVRGNAIRFFAGDRSVVISGDAGNGAAGRVRTVLKVKTADR